MEIEDKIKEIIGKAAGIKGNIFLEMPKQDFGDYAFACFSLSKEQKKNPADIAKQIATKINKLKVKEIEKVTADGGYINFFLEKEGFSKQIVERVINEKEKYGTSNEGNGKNIVIDFSSPNIAKPFNIGHLRSTIIGYSLYKIFNSLGYHSIGINHIGDWGTQFGQLIYAYKKWGSETRLKKEPIKYLLELYVKFNFELEKNPLLQEEARIWFKKLEMGDKEALDLWRNFKDLSLEDFNKIYTMLDVKFDHITGESFYNDKMKKTVDLLKARGITKISQGALVVDLERFNMPPCILEKTDGASTYATRDLTAVMYRNEAFKPEKLIYVVGSEQRLHFKQFFKVLDLAGFEWYDKCIHVPFGLIRLPEGKLSTRLGRVIFMEDVLDKGIELANKIIKQKNPKLKNRDKVARDVAIGAIIYGDISNDRVLDVEFDWNKVLSFEGNSGPYLQYSYVRANSILKNLNKGSGKASFKNIDEKEFILIREISMFNKIIRQAANNFKPNVIANYAYSLSQRFNDFYESCPVLKADKGIKERRIMLVQATRQVLANALGLLGVPVLEEM